MNAILSRGARKESSVAAARHQPAQVHVRAARDDPADMAFLTAQAARVASGAPPWHAPEVIAASVQRAITAALRTPLSRLRICPSGFRAGSQPVPRLPRYRG